MSETKRALERRNVIKGRLYSPSAGRNKSVIAARLSEVLDRNASLLEIASGTGEHGVEVLKNRPDLYWQFSDIDEAALNSQSAWIEHKKYDLPEPLSLNVMNKDWTQHLEKFDAIFCANMLHIAPIGALLGMAVGASNILNSEGIICLYGPFLEGDMSVPSNLKFDRTLKQQNPDWGVRELDFVKHIFAKHGFNKMNRFEMPKNNLFLVLMRK